MVYKKKLEFPFSCYRTPVVPRAPRSIRRKKSGEVQTLCAFELLASVAGKLLEESEGSSSSHATEVKVMPQDENQKEIPNIVECKNVDRGCCNESVFDSETSIQEDNPLPNNKAVHESDHDHSNSHKSSSTSEKLDCDMKLGARENSLKDSDISCGRSPLSIDERLHLKEYVKDHTGDLSVANVLTVKDPLEGSANTSSHVNSESSVKLRLHKEPFPCGLLQSHWDDVKVGIRDDDENFSGSNKDSTRRTFRPQSRIGHCRVRKIMTSRYWKAAPKLKGCGGVYTTTSEGINLFYRCRKSVCARERSQEAPVKKRRVSDHIGVAYDCQDNSNSISSIPGIAADGTSALMKARSKSREHQVAVSIKSFKVPELYFEVPENATVGSLKRAVLEAVTAVLGQGIRVGIVFQGKSVRDDNRTLLQAGISQCSNLDNLGFTLEPSIGHISENPKPEHVSLLRDSDIIKQDSDASKELAPSFPSRRAAGDADKTLDGAVPRFMALSPVSVMKADALAAVPLNQKPKRSELAQRRTRRPFSAAEVEALVEAVEKLGTGRWRDVKMRAFENADHRTYVDLKDKWKTLVHTASISPQQRRGEPVPHELLDRVLSVHSYWSHHQSKHGKLQALELPRITDLQEAAVVA